MYYEEKMIDGVLYYRIAPDAQWQIKPAVLKEAHALIAELRTEIEGLELNLIDSRGDLGEERQSHMRTQRKLAKVKKRSKKYSCALFATYNSRLKYVEDGLKAMVAAYDRLRQGE